MRLPAHVPAAASVLVVCADKNFQRYARAVLRQHGHAVFATGVRIDDVAVQLRLRAPDVVLLDIDHLDAESLRSVLARQAVVEVAEDPLAAGPPAVGKWDAATELVDAVHAAAEAVRRRSLLRVVHR